MNLNVNATVDLDVDEQQAGSADQLRTAQHLGAGSGRRCDLDDSSKPGRPISCAPQHRRRAARDLGVVAILTKMVIVEVKVDGGVQVQVHVKVNVI